MTSRVWTQCTPHTSASRRAVCRFGGERQDRHLRPLARGAQRGRARGRVGDDRRGADGVRDLARGGADRVGRACARRRPCVPAWSVGEVERIGLHAADDAVHHRHRLDRICAGRGLGRQHHRIGAVIDGGRDVGGLGARRHRRVRSSIRASASRRSPACRRGGRHGRSASGSAARPRAASRRRDRRAPPSRASLSSTISSRRRDRRRLLELHQDAGAAGDQLARLGDVLRALHEGERDPVDAQLEREGEIGAVLGRSAPRAAARRSGTLTPLRSDSSPPAITIGLGEIARRSSRP